jgi:hypothetical protein
MNTKLKISKPCDVILNLHNLKQQAEAIHRLTLMILDAESIGNVTTHSHGNLVCMIESQAKAALETAYTLHRNIQGR